MGLVTVILIVAVVFGLCYLVDKGFTKIFRSKKQHMSGKAVRLSKRYGSIGIIMFALGTAAAFMGGNDRDWLLLACGCVLVLGGIALITYYMSFGVYYDEDSFLVVRFGKKELTYKFGDIRCQQLYATTGNVVVELHMTDGTHFQVHTGMTGMYPFMDHAFDAWLLQTGRTKEECTWYDMDNSCWFPELEV